MPDFFRKSRKTRATGKPIIAYDLETTRIQRGTPRPLFVTAYGEAPAFRLARKVDSLDHLADILIERFLLPDFHGTRFVAWNANHFDSYFIGAALLQTGDYVIRPYLTRNKTLRGLRIIPIELIEEKGAGWEFLDGIAMLGAQGVSLKKFLETFAPAYQKLDGPDFDNEEFDPANSAHVRYALQDSIGLYHGMINAQSILLENFNQGLTSTIGNACIKIFQAHLPEGVVVKEPSTELETVIRREVMRGGFCFCKSRYQGRVWKYDLNQAYAAAMREAKLPCGEESWAEGAPADDGRPWIGRVYGVNPENRIPFYHKQLNEAGRPVAVFSLDRLDDVWLTSIEIEQLLDEGWFLHCAESFVWAGCFKMVDFVNKLEKLRVSCVGGPKGAIGTMVKMVGNHSYGRTVMASSDVEYLLAQEKVLDYVQSDVEFDDLNLGHVWERQSENPRRDFQQPQIGAFITAHVRMVVRRAALLRPEHWLYADTDCVMFSSDVTSLLDIDDSRYGAWKIEESGAEYQIIAKKVYASVDRKTKHAKGLHVKRLTGADFDSWLAGSPPIQTQLHRQNFVKVMGGLEMFAERQRRGTRVEMGAAR